MAEHCNIRAKVLKEVNILIINRVDIQLDVSSFRSLVYSFIHSFLCFVLILSFNEASACIACSRLRYGGRKSFSNKKCEKRAGAGERQGGGACMHFFNGLFQYISS